MAKEGSNHPRRRAWFVFAALAVVLLLGATMVSAQTNSASHPKSGGSKISPGTILPVVLQTSVSFQKCKAGQVASGKIAQDVPMANGVKIRKGTAVEGHIVEVAPNSNGAGTRVTLQFDEGSPYEWLPTTQIGGDSVYGQRGQVMSADDPSKVVGKAVPNGVLVQASAKEGSKCREAVDGNDRPQALWVFSSSACGVYGIDDLSIVHAGRTDPTGAIILASNRPNLELRSGDGLLLRVQ